MGTWYEITLTDEDVSAHRHMQLQKEFMARFLVCDPPKEAAMFDDRGVVKGHHFYFSPSAGEFCLSLIARWKGQPCDRPKLENIGLLVGHESAWADLFGSDE